MAVRAIKSLDQLESVRTSWEAWQFHPNSDFDHFRLFCRLSPAVKYPYVVVVEDSGEPVSILAARLERTHLSTSLGYINLIRIPAKVLVVIYQGLLGRVDEKIAESIVGHLWSSLRAGEAEAVVFNHIPENSPLFRALMNHGPGMWCEKKPEWSVHRAMEVPGEPGFILRNLKAKHRSWIRGREKKLNARFPGEVTWRWMDRFDDLPRLCAQIEGVAKQTYQRGLGAGFINNEEYRRRFELFASRGQLRVQVLEIRDRVRGFWIGTVYKGVFYASETGYDPELHDFEVGTLGFVKTTDALANEGVRKIDFGFGEAAYKQRFGSEYWQEATFRMFAPNAKGLALKCVLQGGVVLDRAARQILTRFGFVDRVKTAWRRRLGRSQSEFREG